MMLHRHFEEKRAETAKQTAVPDRKETVVTEAPAEKPQAPEKEPVRRSGRTRKAK